MALLQPRSSQLLEEVFTKLLVGKKERSRLGVGFGLHYEWWSERLRVYFDDMYRKWTVLKDTGDNDFEILGCQLQNIAEINPMAVGNSLPQ